MATAVGKPCLLLYAQSSHGTAGHPVIVRHLPCDVSAMWRCAECGHVMRGIHSAESCGTATGSCAGGQQTTPLCGVSSWTWTPCPWRQMPRLACSVCGADSFYGAHFYCQRQSRPTSPVLRAVTRSQFKLLRWTADAMMSMPLDDVRSCQHGTGPTGTTAASSAGWTSTRAVV